MAGDLRTATQQAAARPSQAADMPNRERDLLHRPKRVLVAMLPDSFPPWKTVYSYFWIWTRGWGMATDQYSLGAASAQEAWPAGVPQRIDY